MNRLSLIIVLGIALPACGTPQDQTPAPTAATTPPVPAGPAPLVAGWTVTQGVDAPESAYVDTASGWIFVSMIGGQPNEKDGNGRIMKLSGDGRVVSTSFVKELNAPKGLRSHDGTLWIADIDEVVSVDIASGGVMSLVKVAGAQFLNDVAIGADGTVYVSDMLGNKIYAIKDGKASVFAQGNVEYPNGLLVEGNRLIVGGWGKPEADFTTKVPGRLFALDLTTKQKTLITPKPFANIDGLESDGRGGYIITDWVKGQVLQVTSAGESRMLKQFMGGTADLAFVANGNIAIVPHMSENKVAAYDLSDVLK